MVSSIVDIKRQNLSRILELVRHSEGIYKKEISDTLKISMGTVSNLCGDLKAADLIYEMEEDGADTVAGRQPKQVFPKKGRYYIVCIDCHQLDNVRLALSDIFGGIRRQFVVSLSECKTAEEFVLAVAGNARKLCENTQETWDDVIGIGVAISAVFDARTQLVASSGIDILENEPIKALLERELSKPVFVDNEANLCAVQMQATHPDEDNLIYIFGSEGLGTGIISGGRMLIGASGYASEICHIPIGRAEYQCGLCGEYRCVQNDLSVSGFLSKYMGRRIETGIPQTKKLWNEFLANVEHKDPGALAVLDENGKILGELVSILTNLFDPVSIYIGGEIAMLAKDLAPFIKKEVSKRRIGPNRDMPLICFDTSSDTIASGCVEQVFRNILSVPVLIKKARNTLQK